MRFGRGAAFALAVVILAACGDKVVGHVASGNRPGTVGTTTTTTAQSTTTSTAAPKPTTTTSASGAAARPAATTTTKPAADPFARDGEYVKRLIVTAADVPGYEFDPEEVAELEHETPEPTTAEDTRCLGVDAKTLDANRTAAKTSPDFDKDDVYLWSYAELYRDPRLLERVFNNLSSESGRRCLMEDAKAAATAEAEPGSQVEVSWLNLGALGDQRIGLRMKLTETYEGVRTTYFDDTILVRKGRAALFFTFDGEDRPFPEAESRAIMNKVLARV